MNSVETALLGSQQKNIVSVHKLPAKGLQKRDPFILALNYADQPSRTRFSLQFWQLPLSVKDDFSNYR